MERETSYVQSVPSARGRTALGRVAASVSRPHQAATPTHTCPQAVARSTVGLVSGPTRSGAETPHRSEGFGSNG